jgi:ribonuclease P protein component
VTGPGLTGGPSGPGLPFRPGQRLRRPGEFQAAFKGRRFGNAWLSASAIPNTTGKARLGLAIAARTVGNAVHRNRLRRRIRESFRLRQHQFPAVDIVVGARNAARNAAPAELDAALTKLWDQVIAQCARC